VGTSDLAGDRQQLPEIAVTSGAAAGRMGPCASWYVDCVKALHAKIAVMMVLSLLEKTDNDT